MYCNAVDVLSKTARKLLAHFTSPKDSIQSVPAGRDLA
jgi:hypothetical protein